MSALKAALWYASQGWRVFPTSPRSKVPRPGSRGLLDATTDVETIRRWWTEAPDANVAINAGQSGLVVIDIDPKNGGDETWHDLRKQHGDVQTLTAHTPSGGMHLFFQAPSGHVIASGANVLGAGVDVRAAGGYALAVPSETDVGKYIWDVEAGPREIKAQPLPGWILAALTATQERRGLQLADTEPIAEGGRNQTLARIAGALRRYGLGPAEIAGALHEVNRLRCKPPLPDRDIDAIAQSIGTREAAEAHILHAERSSDCTAISTAQFLSGDDVVQHLVEGLIPAGGSAIVGAKKKVGKSVLTLNLARSVARGEPFLGRRCQQGTVLYLSLDESAAITRERAQQLGINADDPIVWVASRTRPSAWETWLYELVQAHRPALLVVDTIVKLAGIKHIEDYGEWIAAYQPLYAVADEFGCAFIGSAHNKKVGEINPDSIAGSTAATGGVDTIIVLERALDNARYIMTEQRHGEDLERCVLRIDPDTLELSIGEEAWLRKRREIEQRILDVLATGSLPRDEIIRRVGRRALDVKRALASAVDAGFIELDDCGTNADQPGPRKAGRGVRGQPLLYRARRKAGPRNAEIVLKSLVPNTSYLNRDQETKNGSPMAIPGPESADHERTTRDQAGPRNAEQELLEHATRCIDGTGEEVA